MKILFWNILKGFRDQNRVVDTTKLQIAQEYVIREAPDVVVFNEADYLEAYHEAALDYRVAFGFPHIHGHQYAAHMGNCILSRYPIIDPLVHVAKGRSGLACGIQAGDWSPTVATFHAHPHAPATDKASAILATARLRLGACILVGDFNAMSPDNAPTVADLELRLRAIAHDQSVNMATRLLGDGALIFEQLRQVGFRDLVPEAGRRHTIPSDRPDGDFGTQVRIDHALANRDVAGHAEISTDFTLALVSDHRPIIVCVEQAA